MCSSIVSVIKKYTGVEGWILPDHDSFDVSIGKLLNCKIVSDWMYKDATIYIPRKYEKYLLIKEKVKQKYED